MKSAIKVTTFGKLVIERDGRVVDRFVSLKAMLLFVYLALHPGDHPRKKLAALFWAETTDEQALKNLRTVLSNLRQLLGDALLTSHEDISIDPDVLLEVDAIQFERGFNSVFSAAAPLDRLRAMQSLEAIYQGDFLAALVIRDADALNEWIEACQRQYQEQYRHLLYELTELSIQQGSYETGLGYARKLIQLDGLWDAAQRQLMLLLAYTDRFNEALVQYRQFCERLQQELDAEPETETTELAERIRDRSITPPKAAAVPALVLPDVPYVEPADDIELAQRMLNTPHCRLLTVYGIGGIGKTALVTQLAFHRQHRYRDGACFISLGTAQTERDLLEHVASALNVQFGGSIESETLLHHLLDHLKTRELLIVLDNYEQLLPETRFVQQVLDTTPSVQLIVTSHMPLGMYREWLLPLRGLRVPRINDPDPEEYEAIQLFQLTAQRINPHFQVSDALPEVIRICQLVDCLPLGIIIAAGWVQYIAPADILTMMEQDLLQVEAIHHDLLPRHQSFYGLMNAMLAHLSPNEQHALMCLSIFEGSFDVKAALAVAALNMKSFKVLTDKSLVQSVEGFRYNVHRVVRTAFRTQLEHSPELPQIAQRFAAHFQGWCDAFFERGVPLHDIMHTLDIEAHNLWDVMGLSTLERQRFLLHISPAMHEYWVNRGYHAKGLLSLLDEGGHHPSIEPQTRVRGLTTLARLFERTSQYEKAWQTCKEALALEDGLHMSDFRARVLRVMSEICVRQGRYAEAETYSRAIIAMEPQTSTQMSPQFERLITLAYEDLGGMLIAQGQYDAARMYLDIAHRQWVKLNDPLRQAVTRNYVGLIALKQNQHEEAFRIFVDVLNHARTAQNQTLIAVFSVHLGIAAVALGDIPLACALHEEALLIAVQIDRKVSITHALDHISRLGASFGWYDSAAQLVGFADALREQVGLSISPHNQAEHSAHLRNLQIALKDQFKAHYQAGKAMGLSVAVQRALALLNAFQHVIQAQSTTTSDKVVLD
ncbi:MAG: BTAD domain-containing putative transcriptional regulator [Anaerolineae bacterium]